VKTIVNKVRALLAIILSVAFTINPVGMLPASAAWTQYQTSPPDTYNRPDLTAPYDITAVSFAVSDQNPDLYYFFLTFLKPITAGMFADGQGSWAGILLDIDNNGTLDYSLQTSKTANYKGNYYHEGDFVDRTSGSPLNSSKCAVQTWADLDSTANWIGFRIPKNCLAFRSTLSIRGFADYISSDQINYDYAPEEYWNLSLSGGVISKSTNPSGSTNALTDLPSLSSTAISTISSPDNKPDDLVAIATKVRRSVVTVLCGTGLGTGWAINVTLSNTLINSGYKTFVITNHHVIENCTSARNITIILPDETRVAGYVWAWDEANDVAAIVTKTPLPTLTWMGTTPQQGWWVGVIGSPLGFPGILTTGIVSSANSSKFLGTTTAPINPGNSGGPVWDRSGRVIGLATAKYMGSEGFGIFHGTPLLCGKIVNCVTTDLIWTVKTAAETAAEEAIAAALTSATNAVVIAESSKTQVSKDAANALVTTLPSGTGKTALQSRLTTVQSSIDAAIAAAADKAAADKAAADKAAADKAAADEIIADAKAAAAKIIADAKAAALVAAKKKTTITCVKGKLTKKITAVNPKCPRGYKKK
jgi:hypothetical protein